jgi:peptidoglycan-associated lipoprotein
MNITRIALVLGITSMAAACGGSAENVREETGGDTSGADRRGHGNPVAQSNTSGGEEGCFGDPVYFAFDSAELDASSREKLERAASCVQRRGSADVAVTGMTDPRGTEEYNLALGDRRAQTVAGYMGSLGVSGVATSSVGEEYARGSDEQGFARDRRAEIQAR